MIRTIFAVLFVVVSASASHANTDSVPPIAAQAATDCSTFRAEVEHCGDRRIIRGYADLPSRHIAPAAVENVAIA